MVFSRMVGYLVLNILNIYTIFSMPQVQTYLKEQTYRALEQRAKARGIKLSELMREILEAEVRSQRSPEFLALAGSWEGELERPEQGELETREGL